MMNTKVSKKSPLALLQKLRKTALLAGLTALVLGLSPLTTAPTFAQNTQVPATQEDGAAPEPAVAPQTKITDVHTDMVAAYLDNGKLTLAGKADYDANGDGVVDLHSRVDPATTYFYVNDTAKVQVPNNSAFAFLGKPGDTIWLAPQTQKPGLIWPGFSSEDASLHGHVQSVDVRLDRVEGPGEVQVYSVELGGPNRWFENGSKVTLGVPQHTHVNWAFSKPGVYRLHFSATAQVDGAPQQTSSVYTMVVGGSASDAAGPIATTITASTKQSTVPAGGSATLDYAVAPASAAGYIEVSDAQSGKVLGHTWVNGGAAKFVAKGLTEGKHAFKSRFVPLVEGSYTEAIVINATGSAPATGGNGSDASQPSNQNNPNIPGMNQNTPGVDPNNPGAASNNPGTGSGIPGANPNTPGTTPNNQDQNQSGGGASNQNQQPQQGGNQPAPGGHGGGALPPAAPAPAPQRQGDQCVPQHVFESGHIDMFDVYAAQGRAVMRLLTPSNTTVAPESVLIKVGEHAKTSLGGLPGGPVGYVLPLAQQGNLPWPGWDTNNTRNSGYTVADIQITNVQGPGTVYLYSQSSFGGVESVLGGGYTLPGTIHVDPPAHTHAQWVFTAPGIYLLTAQAVLTNPQNGAKISTAQHQYAFQVGDVPLGGALCGLSVSGDSEAAAASVQQSVQQAKQQQAANKQAEQQKLKAGTTGAPGETKQGANDAKKSQQGGTAGDNAEDGAKGGILLSDPLVITGLVVGGAFLLILGIVIGLIIGRVKWAAKP